MPRNREREGYEFREDVKKAVRDRSEGLCEYPNCSSPLAYIDHIVSVGIAKRLGVRKERVSGYDNAQGLCEFHNFIKTFWDYQEILEFYQERGLVYFPEEIRQRRQRRTRMIADIIA